MDLIPRKVSIYVYNEILGLHLSFGGPLPLASLHHEEAPLETI